MNGRFLAVLVEPAGSPLSRPLEFGRPPQPLRQAGGSSIRSDTDYYTERSIDFLKEVTKG
jgi:hypothetical protein